MILVILCVICAIGLLIILSKQNNSLGYAIRAIICQLNYDIGGLASLLAGAAMRSFNKLDKYPDRKGLTAVITGGGRGIGAYVTKGLVRCGMHVIVGVRRPEQCKDLANEIQKEDQPGTVEFLQLDTSSLASVKIFADRVRREHPEVHLLVNNAGIIDAPHRITEDGLESHMATNYYGHFYLTHLLMKNLKLAGKNGNICSRIVNVSSCAHASCNIIYDDINLMKKYHLATAYSQSKLAQLMFSRFLNRELEAYNLPVKSYATHPGVVDTTMTAKYKKNPITAIIAKLMKSPEEGATTLLYCCLSDYLEGTGGQFISDGFEYISSRFSKNEIEQKRLFDFTTKLLNIENFGCVEENN